MYTGRVISKYYKYDYYYPTYNVPVILHLTKNKFPRISKFIHDLFFHVYSFEFSLPSMVCLKFKNQLSRLYVEPNAQRVSNGFIRSEEFLKDCIDLTSFFNECCRGDILVSINFSNTCYQTVDNYENKSLSIIDSEMSSLRISFYSKTSAALFRLMIPENIHVKVI